MTPKNYFFSYVVLFVGIIIGLNITMSTTNYNKKNPSVLDQKFRIRASIEPIKATTATAEIDGCITSDEINTRLKEHREKKAGLMNILIGFTDHLNKGTMPENVIVEIRREARMFIRDSREFARDLSFRSPLPVAANLRLVDEVSRNEWAALEALLMIDDALRVPVTVTVKSTKKSVEKN